MNRHSRRAIMLTQVVTWLPLFATGTTITLVISAQSLRLQARERAQIATEAVVQDLVRRIQADARRADRIAVAPADAETATAVEMLSTDGAGKVSYQVTGGTVTRTQTTPDTIDSGYTWNLGSCSLSFRIETFGASPGLLWMTFTERVPRDRTSSAAERFSTTALVGRGVQP
ncbi:MAG TPA: hypothetical protein PKY77_03230 [Phycisphaerae bacterium]|nr:hypothetical protein [Phycisphaerae bacterium]HRY67388.1 hypothetical protein [Phycisphaerae bacterium]HSA29320.1 hypothetical protein [Phycisphaerae bacterium]